MRDPLRLLAALSLATLLAPGQAAALSCATPSPTVLYNFSQGAGEPVIFGIGALTHRGPLPENPSVTYEQDENGTTQIVSTGPKTTEYRFEGDLLTPEGRQNGKSFPVSVTAICLASWCGAFPDELENALIALSPAKMEQAGDAPYRITTSPCPGGIDRAPSDAQILALLRCMGMGHCGQQEHASFDE